ncbi:hypothetical protein IQ06DRAFT_44718 [Phaeosphaeriaceae sp. SRC1lsM3a]|nr:hypothetical protein IQ06DRAFT_44718 [Stagonospora sp. SRC1lsM3a]
MQVLHQDVISELIGIDSPSLRHKIARTCPTAMHPQCPSTAALPCLCSTATFRTRNFHTNHYNRQCSLKLCNPKTQLNMSLLNHLQAPRGPRSKILPPAPRQDPCHIHACLSIRAFQSAYPGCAEAVKLLVRCPEVRAVRLGSAKWYVDIACIVEAMVGMIVTRARNADTRMPPCEPFWSRPDDGYRGKDVGGQQPYGSDVLARPQEQG